MADDKSKKFPQDANRINIHEPYELAYWSRKFAVPPQKISDAVGVVGTSASAVERYIKGGK